MLVKYQFLWTSSCSAFQYCCGDRCCENI